MAVKSEPAVRAVPFTLLRTTVASWATPPVRLMMTLSLVGRTLVLSGSLVSVGGRAEGHGAAEVVLGDGQDRSGRRAQQHRRGPPDGALRVRFTVWLPSATRSPRRGMVKVLLVAFGGEHEGPRDVRVVATHSRQRRCRRSSRS